MPFRSFIPNPVQAMQYKAGDNAQSKELSDKLGLSFQPDSQQMTDRNGNTAAISDGDYIGIGEDGNVRRYDRDYFERTYTEMNASAVKGSK